jgi:hypothetical protein
MVRGWIDNLRRRLAAPAHQAGRSRLDITKFGIGFCPGCKRLRGVASARCTYCGSIAAVVEDA